MPKPIQVDSISPGELAGVFRRTNSHSALLVDDEVSSPHGRMIAFRSDLPRGRTTGNPRQDFDIAIVADEHGEIAEIVFHIAISNRVGQSAHRAQCRLTIGKAFRPKDNGISHKFDLLFDRSETQNGVNTKALLGAIAQTGYDLWVVGGAVRDLVSGLCDPEDVNDIDFAGTIPFGLLYNQFLKRLRGVHQFDARLTPNGILHLSHKGAHEAWFQYAALKHDQFLAEQKRRNQLWFSGSLESDVKWRDLTINCLFYDPLTNILFDPTGEGVKDLQDARLSPILPIEWGGQPSKALFRTLKFADRYRPLAFDLEPARNFLDQAFDLCCTDFLSLGVVAKANMVLAFYGGRAKVNADRQLTKLQLIAELFELPRFPRWSELVEAAVDAVHG